MCASEPHVASTIPKRRSRAVEPDQVKHSGVEILEFDSDFCGSTTAFRESSFLISK